MKLPITGPLPEPTNLDDARETLKNEAFPAANVDTITFTVTEFTSTCPRTGQPDFCTLTITYQPRDVCIESKSLKVYLWAYRNAGAFAETLAAQIADDINTAIQPKHVTVTIHQNPRGGIALDATATRKS